MQRANLLEKTLMLGKREVGKGYALLERKIYRKVQRMNTGAGKPGLEQMRLQPPMRVLVTEATT